MSEFEVGFLAMVIGALAVFALALAYASRVAPGPQHNAPPAGTPRSVGYPQQQTPVATPPGVHSH